MAAAARWLMALKLWPVLSARRAVRTRLPCASVSAEKSSFSPRTWSGWIAVNEHRNEEIKKAAAGIPNFSRIRRVLLRQIAITNFINPF
jgi:hypothetical protein